MIFEDGRPWPREDWELASTYRAVIEDQRFDPDVFQWGPLTFAHNTPALLTFWASKWWRVREIAEHGSNWITGCANHDTLRRGSQIPAEQRRNPYLGERRKEVFRNAYDNHAAELLTHGFLPGVPMDFLNASVRGAWCFVRNTDERYAVSVAAQESRVFEWQLAAEDFEDPGVFHRVRSLGFRDLASLRRFGEALRAAVALSGGDDERCAVIVDAAAVPGVPGDLDGAALRRFARAFMEDAHDLCVVDRYLEDLDPERVRFFCALRRFRQRRPWLRRDLGERDCFDRLHPCDGAVVCVGLRYSPTGDEVLLLAANLEGRPRTLELLEVVPAELPREGWEAVAATPGLQVADLAAPCTLRDSAGVLFARKL